MKLIASAFFSACIFGIGLGISGMTLPSKVIGFLDITGDWDISLMFVMVGAILTHALLYRWIIKRTTPVYAPQFYLPTRKDLDRPLIAGSVLFGIGWGLAGFCPGPALVTVVTGKREVIVFVAFMILGMYLFRLYKNVQRKNS